MTDIIHGVAHHTVTWEQLPDLPLYMDQVITYLERQLAPYQVLQPERLITPAMINNYVKSGLIPRPERKKYTRIHLALLLMVCILKQILPIQQMGVLLRACTPDLLPLRFNAFGLLQNRALSDISTLLTEETAALQDADSRLEMTFQLLLRANAYRMAGQQLLQTDQPVMESCEATPVH
ncbi:MAG: DUF1836 domain-containing protein [Clostridia bacterium]